MTKEIYVVYSVYFADVGYAIKPRIGEIEGAFYTLEDATKFIREKPRPWLHSCDKTTLHVKEE